MDGKFAERIRAKEALAAPNSSVDVAAHGAPLCSQPFVHEPGLASQFLRLHKQPPLETSVFSALNYWAGAVATVKDGTRSLVFYRVSHRPSSSCVPDYFMTAYAP